MADKRQKRVAEFIEPFRVKPGLEGDPRQGLRSRLQGRRQEEEGGRRAARGGRAAAGRIPGAARRAGHVGRAGGAPGPRRRGQGRHDPPRDERREPAGRRVHSFKVPSAEELDHDFLWRYAQRLPARGEIGIFNRSHYEEVLVVRVHPENLDRQKLPKAARRGDVWQRRYREINDWERYLTDNGLPDREAVPEPLKEEQRTRLLRRIDLPDHNWKFSDGRRRRARALGRLPAGVLGDALAHEHRVGAVVRDPGRPQVVRADRRRGRARARADGDRPALPDRQQAAARSAARGQGGARGAGAEGRRAGPVRARARRQGARSREAASTRRRPMPGRAHGRRSGRDGWRATATGGSRRAPDALVRGLGRGGRGEAAASIRRSGCPPSEAAELLARARPERAAAESRCPGWRRFLRAVPQLHADDPASAPRSSRWRSRSGARACCWC